MKTEPNTSDFSEIQLKLIKASVSNLREFGYPNVTSENIFTDEVYKLFFENMLNENKGASNRIDEAINDLIEQLNKDI